MKLHYWTYSCKFAKGKIGVFNFNVALKNGGFLASHFTFLDKNFLTIFFPQANI